MKVLNGAGPSRTADLESAIRRHPLEVLGIGFLAGFVLGGGQKTQVGQGLIGFVARAAVKQAVLAAITEALNHERYREIESDLKQARENLDHTLEEMNRKAESSTAILAEQPIRQYPMASLCGAMALGLAAGGAPRMAVILGIIAIGALVGPDDPDSTDSSSR